MQNMGRGYMRKYAPNVLAWFKPQHITRIIRTPTMAWKDNQKIGVSPSSMRG